MISIFFDKDKFVFVAGSNQIQKEDKYPPFAFLIFTFELIMIIDSLKDIQAYITYIVAPRPICFASTINKAGQINLSPFSYFNVASGIPPVLMFSVLRRVRDNTTKHTLENILEVPEVGINIVTYDMVQQTSLSSCEYPKDINEFAKAGFTMQTSTKIKPPLVKESKIKIETKVIDIKSFGEHGGAGQVIFAEILCIHINESILDDKKMIDQTKLPLVARLGGDWYCAVRPDNLFEIAKPNRNLGIGIDNLPGNIRNSSILTGNHLAQLANVQSIPTIDPAFTDEKLKNIFQYYSINPFEMEKEIQFYAKDLLEKNKVNEAWQVLLTLSS